MRVSLASSPPSPRYNQPYPQPHLGPPHKLRPNRSNQPQVYSPPIATLPEENEHEPDQQEPEPDQQENEQEQQEPEPNQHKTKRDIESKRAQLRAYHACIERSVLRDKGTVLD